MQVSDQSITLCIKSFDLLIHEDVARKQAVDCKYDFCTASHGTDACNDDDPKQKTNNLCLVAHYFKQV